MRAHFIGIKGVSMGFLAKLCQREGLEVSGSDLRLSGHDASSVDGADMVVYSHAIGADNAELIRAKELGIPLFNRAELLGKVAKSFDRVVAVSGTHGKTTTTAMLAATLAYLNPTAHVGGSVRGEVGKVGGKELFITEACEYRESFLSLYPDVAIALNVELDHADYFGSYASIYGAFEKFCLQSKVALVCGDNEARTLRGKEQTFTFGLDASNDYYAQIQGCSSGYYSFSAFFRGQKFAQVRLNVRGQHNVLNAMAVLAYCHYAQLDCNGIADFYGVDRRFESLGKAGGVEFISDYAHHPREIECTLRTAKRIYDRVLAVFEPHTYTRTQAFYKSFATSLSIADGCILLPVYAAREDEIQGVSSSLIGSQGGFLEAKSYEEAEKMIKEHLPNYDAVVIMGAGTVDDFARTAVANLK